MKASSASPRHTNAIPYTLTAAIGFTLLFWFADSFLDYTFNPAPGKNFVDHLLPMQHIKDFWLHLIFLLAAVAAGIALGIMLNMLLAQRREKEIHAQNLNAILNSIGEAVVATDLHGNIIRMNAIAEEFAGQSAETLAGSPVWDIFQVFYPELGQEKENPVARALQYRRLITEPSELELVSWNGKRYRIDHSAAPIMNAIDDREKQTITGAVWSFRDISDKHRMQQSVKASETKYRTLFNSSADAIFLHDLQGIIKEANDTACSTYGYSCEQLIGMNINKLDCKEYADLIPERMREVAQKGHATFETVHETSAGNSLDIEVKVKTIAVNDEHLVLSISHDMTRRKRTEQEQRRLQNRLKAGLRAGDLAWWEMALPSGKVTFDNRKAEMLGYDPARFQHYEDFTELIHPEDYPRTMQAMRDFLHGNAPAYEAEYRIQTKHGNYKWFRDIGSATQKEEEQARHIIGIVEDITRRKEAEEALRNSEEQLRTLIQATPDIVCFKDGQGRWMQANSAYLNLLGMSGISYSGKTDAELAQFATRFHKPLLEQQHTKDENVWQKGEMERYEVPLPKPDGSSNTYDIIKIPVFNSRGGRKGLVVLGRDITQRKNAIEARIKSDTLNKEIIATVNEGIIVVDQEFRYVTWNKFMEGLTGLSAEKVTGKVAFELFPHLQQNHVKKLLNRALHGETVNLHDTAFHVPQTNKQGWFAATYAPHHDAKGEITGVIATISDVTERKEMQQKILNTTIETEERERSRIARELHDGIGPLLSTVKLFTQTYINSGNEAYKERVKDELLKTIEEAIEQISMVSNRLSPQILSDFGLKKALENFVGKIQKASSIRIQFTCNLEAHIRLEKEVTLYRAATELINNTLKHAEASEITLAVRQETRIIRLTYTDNGKGIDFDSLKDKGAGMGLFNIHNRIKSLQGEMDMKTTAGQGVKFELTLPLEE